MRFVDPKNNVAFQKIFGSEQRKEILISFLNAVLDLTGEKEITDIELLNPYQAPRIEGLKGTILDVRARDRRGVFFIVEMQVCRTPGIKKRFTYYAAKGYVSQIIRGADYPKLNQVVFIGILDFNEFENEHYLSRHVFMNTKTLKQEIMDLELNFIELPKFDKKETELENILEKWVYFIKNASDLSIIPEHAAETVLRSAYEAANEFDWTRDEMDVYDYWSMKEQDERGAAELARTEGLAKGLAEGLAEGLAKGKAEGESKAKQDLVLGMVAEGLSIAVIAKITGLSQVNIEQIVAQKNQSIIIGKTN